VVSHRFSLQVFRAGFFNSVSYFLIGNQLTELFPLEGLVKLAVVDINRNNFTSLPEDMGSASLENLSQINASYNQLSQLPDSLSELPSLKLLNVENNVLLEIPSSLSQCAKLKDLLAKTNKLKDNRLKKLIEQDKVKRRNSFLLLNF
jgi:Leucine-rich repeat (LRR) protein